MNGVSTVGDYTELISTLREEADAVKAIEWEIPICTENHILEAADVIEKLVKERDAAVKDLNYMIGPYSFSCRICKNLNNDCCNEKGFQCKWEWRGVQG